MLARRIALLWGLSASLAGAQDASLVTVPALTPVAVRLEEPVSSNRNKPGDHFRITVAEDVRIGDALVIPDQSTNALAAGMLIGPFAMFVKGGVITVPPATLGTAKTALESRLPAIVSPTPEPAGPSTEASKGEENESQVD